MLAEADQNDEGRSDGKNGDKKDTGQEDTGITDTLQIIEQRLIKKGLGKEIGDEERKKENSKVFVVPVHIYLVCPSLEQIRSVSIDGD